MGRKWGWIALLLVIALLSGCMFGARYSLVDYGDMAYSRPDVTAFNRALEESCRLAQEETGIRKLAAAVSEFTQLYNDFYTNSNLAFIRYSSNLKDLYWEAEYAYCSRNSATVTAGLDRLYRTLAKSPLRDKLETDEYFGANFFDAYEGDSIYDDHLLSLMEQEAALQSQYQAINAEAADTTYYSDAYFTQYGTQMAQVFLHLVQLRQEIAAYAGYESYVDFAYDTYHIRDYTPQQAISLLTDVRAELVPLYRQLGTYDFAEDVSGCTERQMLAYVRSGAKNMGSVIYEAFTAMEKAGVYDITYSESKYNTSFEVYLPAYSTPFVFVCPTGTDYDKLTLAHEFGHFCCDYANVGGAHQSVDVAEIFSQSMELLSLCYADGGEKLEKLKLADCLGVYVEQAAYASFEHQVYDLKGENLTVAGIQSLYEDVLCAYGLDTAARDSRDYVCIPHFYESPLYIVSYVVSVDAALQIYELEQTRAGQGLACFEKGMTAAQPYFSAFLEEVGLHSPFEAGQMSRTKQTLQKIFQ